MFTEIQFISNNGIYFFQITVFLDKIKPVGDIVVGFIIGEVEDNDSDLAVADVTGDKTAEALLTGGVPELQADHLLAD
jgi:effector-binding domain-containing protein